MPQTLIAPLKMMSFDDARRPKSKTLSPTARPPRHSYSQRELPSAWGSNN